MIELLGLLLVVQGAGGLINRLAGAGNPSWFVQLHVLPPSPHPAASVVLLVAGVAAVRSAGPKTPPRSAVSRLLC